MLLRWISTIVFLHLILHEIQAQPVTCITCISCQDLYDGTDLNSTCSSTVPNANSCQKVRIQLPGTTLVSKACSKNCQEQAIIAGAIRLDVSCCKTSNCNTATTVTLRPSYFFLSVIISRLFL